MRTATTVVVVGWMATAVAAFGGSAFGWSASAHGAEPAREHATQVTSPAPAHGDEPSVELQWRAPPGCPGGARVRDEIARFVAAGTQTGTVDRVQVDAVIEQIGERYVLELELRLPTGALRKRIEATECAVLASAAALVMAVMLDPTAVVETVDAAAPPEVAPVVPPPVVVPVPPVVPAPVPPPIPRTKPMPQATLRLSALGSFGAMPRFGAALAGAIGVRVGRARAELVALGELPQRTRHPREPIAGARVDLWSVGGRGCFAPAVKKVDFPLCAGFEGGRIRARGFGLQIARRAVAPWLAAPFGAAVMWAPIPRLALGGGVDGWIAMTRPTFEIEDLGVVHHVSRAGVRVHLGVELRFP